MVAFVRFQELIYFHMFNAVQVFEKPKISMEKESLIELLNYVHTYI